MPFSTGPTAFFCSRTDLMARPTNHESLLALRGVLRGRRPRHTDEQNNGNKLLAAHGTSLISLATRQIIQGLARIVNAAYA